MNHLARLPLWLIAILLAAGCASTPRPLYAPEAAVPADRAVVYVYRDAGVIGGAVAYTVSANGTPIAKLPPGGYFPYYAKPGEIEFTARTEATTSVTIDARAGQTYYIKGSIGIGLLVGHPHLVVVANEVGAAEIAACTLVPGVSSTAAEGVAEGAERPRTAGGPFSTAVVQVAAADVVAPSARASSVNVAVADRRARIVMEHTTIGHTAMSAVVLQPAETELVGAVIGAKLAEAMAAQGGAAGAAPIACDITEFSITTPATMLYWDVTTDIALTLHAGDRSRNLAAHASKRTYAWPSTSLIQSTTIEALKAIAAQSGPALRELLATPPPAAPAN